jgi:D-glycero-D-manno-heptose 1,7-bisphosphate phosphatase
MRKGIFLDRDGVLNESLIIEGLPYPPKIVSEVVICKDVKESLDQARNNGFEVVVVSNQPDVARGKLKSEQVQVINEHLAQELNLNHFYTCFHDDPDNCECRKPKPGLLLQAARDLRIDLNQSFMIGDRWRDVEAGNKAGCISYFIDYNYEEARPIEPYFSVSSLQEAIEHIVRNYSDPIHR